MKIKIKKGLTNSKKTEQLVRMEATQFPVVSNNATTGWKLQGTSVQNLFIKEWFSKKNVGHM